MSRKCFWGAVLMITAATVALAEPYTNKPPVLDLLFVNQSEILWGKDTNGAAGGIYVKTNPPIGAVVFLRTLADKAETSSNKGTGEFSTGTYFKLTYSLSGIVELRDEKGESLSLRNRDLNSPGAYPEIMSLRAVRSDFMSHYKFYSGAEIPPAFVGSPMGRLGTFHLSDYFERVPPGQYELTVWPKVYKRSLTNSDICHRIDLPPVSVKLNVGDHKN